VPHGNHRIVAATNSVVNKAVISAVQNLPVTRFISQWVMIDDAHTGHRSSFQTA